MTQQSNYHSTFVLIVPLLIKQTCHLVRIVRIHTDLRQITEKHFMNMCSETKQFYRRTQPAFSAKFPKNGRFRLPWSAIDLVNQRRPNPTVAPRDVKLRFWFFAAGCRFILQNVAIFLQTASRYERFRDTSMHKKEGYGLIQIFTEKIRISPTKLWRV